MGAEKGRKPSNAKRMMNEELYERVSDIFATSPPKDNLMTLPEADQEAIRAAFNDYAEIISSVYLDGAVDLADIVSHAWTAGCTYASTHGAPWETK